MPNMTVSTHEIAAASPTRADHPPAGRGIGWALLIALVISVCVAISMAVQLGPERAAPEPTPCGGLFAECCVAPDNGWTACGDDCSDAERSWTDREGNEGQGLFDAEEDFADHRRPANC